MRENALGIAASRFSARARERSGSLAALLTGFWVDLGWSCGDALRGSGVAGKCGRR